MSPGGARRTLPYGNPRRSFRNTTADSNQVRGRRISAGFIQVLIGSAGRPYANGKFGVVSDHTSYALDSTTIDLCLSLFPRAKFRKRKGAVKMHTLLDLRGSNPGIVIITHGRVHDVNILDGIIMEPGAFYVMDRAYMDYVRLYTMHQSLALFVTRAKRKFNFERPYSRLMDKSTGVQCGQIAVLRGLYAGKNHPEKLRRIRCCDTGRNKRLLFPANDFTLPALTIEELYRRRCHVELFFKWIKQHLRIKAFHGTSENAVKTRIRTAISVYAIAAIVEKHLDPDVGLHTILRISSVTLSEKTHILQALSRYDCGEPDGDP